MKKVCFTLFTIAMCMMSMNVMAMGIDEGYAIETGLDKGVEVYKVLEPDKKLGKVEREEAMREIIKLTGDPYYGSSAALIASSDSLYRNGYGYDDTTTVYGWKRLYKYPDLHFNYVFEGGQSAMWTGTGDCDKIILFENINVTSLVKEIAWPFAAGASTSSSSASWTSEAFTGTNVAGATYSNLKISASSTLRITFTDGADIYKGNRVRRPMVTLEY